MEKYNPNISSDWPDRGVKAVFFETYFGVCGGSGYIDNKGAYMRQNQDQRVAFSSADSGSADGGDLKTTSFLAPRNLRQLEAMLNSAGVSVAAWGTGEAKDLAALWREMEDGETRLIEEAGRVVRCIRAVNIYVLYLAPDDKLYELKEIRQVFSDGRERERKLNCSISEKGKPTEDAEVTARRALKEELGINAAIRLRLLGSEQHERISHSYPGLPTRAEIITFCVHFSGREYDPRGYVEKSRELTSFFSWRQVPDRLRSG